MGGEKMEIFKKMGRISVFDLDGMLEKMYI